MSNNAHFEERIEKAKTILDRLTHPDVTLDEGMKLYKDGLQELEVAQKMLEEAKIIYQELAKENR